MTIKTINCADCGGSFNYEPNPNYADNRKYCDLCGAKRKAAFEGKPQIANPDVAAAVAIAANRGPNATGDKFTTMYVSYAKDIFCAVWDNSTTADSKEVMQVCIDRVKQAQEAFS